MEHTLASTRYVSFVYLLSICVCFAPRALHLFAHFKFHHLSPWVVHFALCTLFVCGGSSFVVFAHCVFAFLFHNPPRHYACVCLCMCLCTLCLCILCLCTLSLCVYLCVIHFESMHCVYLYTINMCTLSIYALCLFL
jgi:hypothetical protein